MDNAYFDVDAFLAETAPTRKAPIVKLFGQEWALPEDAPASAILRAQRVAAVASKAKDRLAALDPDDPVPADLVELIDFNPEEHARALLGTANVDAWLDKGIGNQALRNIVVWAMRHYQGAGSDGDEGKASAPASGESDSTES